MVKEKALCVAIYVMPLNLTAVGLDNLFFCGWFCRTLLSSELGDEDGVLTVGGQASSNFYTGTLQDVRIYQGILQLR